MGDGGDGRAKKKDRFHLEMETESIFLRVSDRTVPPTLSSLGKADLPSHHVPTNSCYISLLFLYLSPDSHVMSHKKHTQTNTKHIEKQKLFPCNRMYQCQLQSRNLQPVRGAISMPGLKRDQMSHGVREKMSAQTQHTIFLG